MIIWKYDLFDNMKWEFFQEVTVSLLQYGCITGTLTNCSECKNATYCFEPIQEATPLNISTVK